MRRRGEIPRTQPRLPQPAVCVIDGCEQRTNAKGLCPKHYWRSRNNSAGRRPEIERFHSFLPHDLTEAGCWTWAGTRNSAGYGYFNSDGRPQMAHRISYQMYVGPIPEGFEIDHLCSNPSCVNPAHLEPVTPRINTLRSRGITAQLASRTECHICGGNLIPASPNDPKRRRICRQCQHRRLAEYRARKKANLTAGL